MKTSAIKKFMSVLAAVVCLGWTAPARAFDGGALGQLGVTADVKDNVNGLNIPVGAAFQMDIFSGIQACKVLDRTFVMKPTMADALKMLRPCVESVSGYYGLTVYAVKDASTNPEQIQIVVLDSGPGSRVVIDLKAALARRGGGLFGHRATLFLMEDSPMSAPAAIDAPSIGDCREVSAMVETNARINARFALSRLVERSMEYRLVVPDSDRGMMCERMGDGVLRMTIYTKLASPAFEFSAPVHGKNSRHVQWVAPVYPPNRKIIKKAVYLFGIEEGKILDQRISLASEGKD